MTISQIQFTKHARCRASQRGISIISVATVIQYGKVIHKQGLKFIFIPKTQMEKFSPDEQKALQKLLVITDKQYKEVVTCYRSDKGLKRIRKKSKRLSVYNQEHLPISSRTN
ncbi:DUF4258 domain-containing protein [Cecembia calidifontis]|uniref:Uncharacterized protein DUF4258 n=1 Tax=Cecembia calidifontis TaxID=1187080 RepID=A0A4Q7PE94_9BACT|nr:DUF4258 domain-containing protein [Cecembia calidifontis]RZS97152.1 uncharacterized protein DUF4258 [Cecembia calidifontis]